MMHPAARPLAWTLAAFTVSLFAIGCSDLPVDTSMPVITPAGPSAQRSFAVAVTCTASVAEGSIACARPRPSTGTFGPNFLIVGGQDQFVTLTSSNVSYDGGAELFQADVTVTNLFGQPLGTTDAVTSTGVRVFFHDGPTVTSGTGIVTVANADGTGAFTGSDQPYHLYDQILWTNIPSTAKTWEWNVPSTATTFTFEVYVEGDVVFPNGWVVVTPHPIGVQTGASVQLSATILDVVTRAVPGTVTWSSPADTIAAVDANGLVDGIAPGVVDIVASNGGPQADGSARVTVIGNGFDITLRAAAGTQDPSPSILAAFVSAKARWESLITADLRNHLLRQPAIPDCAPDLNEVIDDVLIIVYVDTIDGPGNILGWAGPCWLRGGGGADIGMPLTGIMQFDIEDIGDLDADGLLEDVIVHEMGHVLGIGILWGNQLIPNACDDTSVDPYFDGTFAVAAFDAAGGTGYTGNKVPVEDTGLEGTICSHWRESVFANEMMTGWIDPTYNPLSAITVASLADIGYTVDASGADPYTLPSGAGVALRTGGIAVNNDIRRGPLYIVDEQGGVTTIAAPAPRR